MNTLPRAITAHVLTGPDHYLSLRRHWGKLMSSTRKHELTAAHHLLYLALLGKDWRTGFTCVTNPRKLENGAFFSWGLFRALTVLHMPSREAELLKPFDGLVTPAMIDHIRQLVPYQSPSHYHPEQFVALNFPFEAYTLPESA